MKTIKNKPHAASPNGRGVIESIVRASLALVIAFGLVASASAESRVFKVVENSDWRFSQKITLPDFPPDSKLLAHVHVIPKGDPWDRNGRVVLNTPKGQVDLVKFITGFGGETRHTVDVTNLRPLLKGDVTISGDIPHYVGNWRMDFHIEEVLGGNKGVPTVWAAPVVSSGTNWGHGAFAKPRQSFTVEVPKEPFEKIWLTYYATGHGGGNGKTCCEFKKRTHRIWVNGKKVLETIPWRNASKKFRSVNPCSGRFANDRWSSDFARAGWLPGDRVHPFVIDVTSAIGESSDGKSKIEFEIEGDLRGGHFTVSSFLSATAAPKKGLVFDEKIGHYKDLSYEALTDEDLSWEERTILFGGETVHYGELTDEERQAKEKELADLLAKIDMTLVEQCKADIRKWLDQQPGNLPSAYSGRDVWNVRFGAVAFFRAYEIFGDKKYLDAGLARANLILKAQFPKGHWPWGEYEEDFIRIQDGYNDWPFWIMLYAHKLTGDKKYFDSARRCADVLLSLQRGSGGWPDQWTFSGRGTGHTGVRLGTSHNDNATTAPFKMMVMMYHMTKDKKYVAKLGNLGPFIAATNLGEGKVVGWAEQYGNNKPVRARGYEIELPYPRALTRSVGPLLIWLYLMTGDEAHMDLLRKAYAWHEHVRQQELDPKQLEAWKLMHESWAKAGRPMHYRPGWPDAWLPDGSNWGRVTAYKMIPWFPVTAEMKKKYGGIIHSSETDHGAWPGNVGYLLNWGKEIRAGGAHPECSMGFSHAARGNALVQVRRALLEYKRGGHKGLLKYYTSPTKYTAGQYLQARVDAAKRAINERNVKLAANPEKKGILALKDSSGLIGQKGRWYGPRLSKWGTAFNTTGQYGSVAWYQWQLVYDTMLAQGKISADAAVRGGRGLETVASQTHLDSWDVLGEWGMRVHEVENYFDVPVEKK